jgi:pimeloyl-ACP methyl ester carboxylesterase
MMPTRHLSLTVLLVVVVHAAASTRTVVATQQDAAPDCAAMTNAQLPNVRITEAVAVAAAPAGRIKAAHCKVSGVIEKEIRFTALLPERWNGRFMAGGGGGFVGSVDNQAQPSVDNGFATIGTDTGHQGLAFDATWALNNRERLINYGHRAIHVVAETGKALIKAHYGKAPQYSYFFGCSNGGRQGLMEAQRYPGDFDGIVACAPALDFTSIAASFIRNTQGVFPTPQDLANAAISRDNLQLLGSRVLATCDAMDGVKDNVLDDPRECRFRVSDLPACAGDTPGADCVTSAQRKAIERIYSPTTVGGATLYPGQPFGAEADPQGWQAWITGANVPAALGFKGSLHYAFGTGFFKYFVFNNPNWDYSTYDLASALKDTREVGEHLNADNDDLTAFRARKGKLILAHGWADPALNPLSTIAYYERVLARDRKAGESVRLFMEPGVTHCLGGAGPDTIDWFSAITDWVERDRAPERVIARKLEKGSVINERPLCPYPQRAHYDGKGNPNEAASFTCR